MNSLVIALVLGAAFSHALWNMLLKKTENRLLMMTAMHTVTGVMGLFILPMLGPIDGEAWKLLWLSVFVHGAYYVFLTYSYRHIELGQAYPILRGSGPLIVFLASLYLVDEVITQSITIEVKVLWLGVHPRVTGLIALLGTEIILTLGVATHDLALAGVGIVDGSQNQLTLVALILRASRGATHVADRGQQDGGQHANHCNNNEKLNDGEGTSRS
mgnify:CR=1 FL=1